MDCIEDQDLIYVLKKKNGTHEKFHIFIYPNLKSDEQAIIFTPHLATIDKEVKKLKEKNISCVAYTNQVDYWRRDRIRELFENGNIQFLYTTPRMYFKNEFFRDFVDEQVQDGNLSCIVFDDAKYLFEYDYDSDKYDDYQNISQLKDLAPDQRWVVLVDGKSEEDLDDIADVLHLEDPAVFEIRHGVNGKGVYHKYLYDL